MKLPTLTDAEIAQQTTEKVFQRGVDYHAQGMVLSVTRRENLIQAQVEGSADEPYLITVSLDKKSAIEADCTCPYGEEWDGWCKHIVATLLFCRESEGEIEELPALDALLSRLNRDQLQTLVQKLAKDNPRLVSNIAARAKRIK